MNKRLFLSVPHMGGNELKYIEKVFESNYLDEKLTYKEDWKDNLVMLRYDAEVLVDGNSI